jgi:hypothetical protein
VVSQSVSQSVRLSVCLSHSSCAPSPGRLSPSSQEQGAATASRQVVWAEHTGSPAETWGGGIVICVICVVLAGLGLASYVSVSFLVFLTGSSPVSEAAFLSLQFASPTESHAPDGRAWEEGRAGGEAEGARPKEKQKGGECFNARMLQPSWLWTPPPQGCWPGVEPHCVFNS